MVLTSLNDQEWFITYSLDFYFLRNIICDLFNLSNFHFYAKQFKIVK